jgi:integrase
MPHPKNLHLRSNGTFYARLFIPSDLVPRFGRRELTRSLRTSRLNEAERTLTILKAASLRLFAMTRANLSLSTAQIDTMARSYFESSLSEVEDMRLSRRIPGHFDDDRPYDHRHAELDTLAEVADIARDSRDRNILTNAEEGISVIEQTEGVTLPRDTREYRQLAHKVLRADCEVARIIHERACGNFDAAPKDLLFSKAQSVAEQVPTSSTLAITPHMELNAGLTLTEVYGRWLSERKPTHRTKLEWDTAVNRFVELHGDLPVSGIGPGHIRDFKDILRQLPRRRSGEWITMPLRELVAKTCDDPSVSRVANETVKKQLGALKALLGFAVDNGFCAANVAGAIKFRAGKAVEPPRIPYDPDDLKRIFEQSPLYRGCHSPARRSQSGTTVIRDALFWMPLLGLFTGARLEEIGQSQVEDIREENGVWLLDINAQGSGKSLKTKGSRRKVPLHPELIRCGFLIYVDGIRAQGERSLFPDLKPDCAGRITGYLSKQWARYSDNIGMTDSRKTFHSFRHGFKDACRAAGIEEAVFDAVMGHSSGSVSRRYGQGYPVARLAEAMAQVRYDDLDLSHLHTARKNEG